MRVRQPPSQGHPGRRRGRPAAGSGPIDNRPHTGPTGRETPAQGRGRRPMPWEEGHPSLRPIRPRELHVLSDIVGHLKRSHAGLPSRGPQTPDLRSRGPSGRIALSISSPRAGIKDFTILVSEDGSPFAEWLSHTSETSGAFHGVVGRSYAFYSVAHDQGVIWRLLRLSRTLLRKYCLTNRRLPSAETSQYLPMLPAELRI